MCLQHLLLAVGSETNESVKQRQAATVMTTVCQKTKKKSRDENKMYEVNAIHGRDIVQMKSIWDGGKKTFRISRREAAGHKEPVLGTRGRGSRSSQNLSAGAGRGERRVLTVMSPCDRLKGRLHLCTCVHAYVWIKREAFSHNLSYVVVLRIK